MSAVALYIVMHIHAQLTPHFYSLLPENISIAQQRIPEDLSGLVDSSLKLPDQKQLVCYDVESRFNFWQFPLIQTKRRQEGIFTLTYILGVSEDQTG